MTGEIHHRLDSAFASYEIVRQIHDVPPHEVYEITAAGRRAVYKGNTGPTGTAEREGAVTAFVDEQTAVPVPEVLCVGAEYYVAAWHPDAPVPDEGETPDETWARAAGRGIATLHDETAGLLDGYGYFERRDGTLATSGHAEWHAAAVEYVEHHRPVLAEYGHADVAEDVLAFLRERPDLFAGAGGPVCCHGWATPDHVSVSDGEMACLLDFEHAIAAPGEFDYWRTIPPTFGPADDSPKEAFREGYESVRSLPGGFDERARLWGLLNLVYYFESLYVQDQHGPAETADRAEGLRDAVSETLAALSE